MSVLRHGRIGMVRGSCLVMLCAGLCAVAAWSRAEVVPAACFGDGMVLQRDMPLPIWGTAAPDEQVTVSFGDSQAVAVADAAGRWRATLPPQPASAAPRPLVIRGTNDVRVDDVLVGEVWLCAGQSNMLLPFARASAAAREIAAANRPRLRLLKLRTASGGDPPPYTPAQVRDLEPARFCTGSWTACTPETVQSFSAVGYFFGAALEDALDVPVGIICAAVGGSPTEAWIPRAALAADPGLAPLVQGDWLDNPALAGWCTARAGQNLARARRAGEPIPGDDLGPNHPFKPGFLFDACIAPLVPLAIRGVAWYQGESNADSPARVTQHARLLPVLVSDWRRAWALADLPFAVVQLPGMNRPDWPAFRETQRRAVAALEHAGLIVTIDLGAKNEVHPSDKQPIGARLAAWALADVYGRRDVVASGPVPAQTEFRDDGSVVVHFAFAGGLTTRDGAAPRHFEVAGPDGGFRPATARIAGATVIITPQDPAVLKSVEAVRYAWAPFPDPPANLVNAAALPATPFHAERPCAAEVRRPP